MFEPNLIWMEVNDTKIFIQLFYNCRSHSTNILLYIRQQTGGMGFLTCKPKTQKVVWDCFTHLEKLLGDQPQKELKGILVHLPYKWTPYLMNITVQLLEMHKAFRHTKGAEWCLVPPLFCWNCQISDIFRNKHRRATVTIHLDAEPDFINFSADRDRYVH